MSDLLPENCITLVSYRDGESYGIALRDEDYPSFLERERPVVFIGEPNSDDIEWWTYANENDFIQVLEDVWIEGDYYSSLIENATIPEIEVTVPTTQIVLGDCITLEWNIINSEIIFLDDEPINSSDTISDCPLYTTDYILSAYWVGGLVQETLVIEVE